MLTSKQSLALLCLLVVSVVAISPKDLPRAHAGFNTERSGDMVVVPRRTSSSAGTMLVLDAAAQSSATEPVELWRVADMIAHGLGLLPMAQGAAASYAPEFDDLWAPAAANILIAVPGLELSKEETPALWALAHGPTTATFPLAAASLPASGLADLVTAVTAQSPSVHGIVGTVWPSAAVSSEHAFATPSNGALAASFVDLLHASAPAAAVVAFAADAAVARSLAPMTAGGCPLAATVFLTEGTNAAKVESCNGLGASLAAPLSAQPATARFAAEMAALAALPAALAAEPALAVAFADSAADALSVAVSSYAELAATAAGPAARAQLDAALPALARALAALFPERKVATQILLLSAPSLSAASPSAAAASAIATALGGALHSSAADLPFIRLTTEARSAARAHCRAVADALEPLELEVFCPRRNTRADGAVGGRGRNAAVRGMQYNYTANNTFYDDSSSLNYQTAFWTTVLLVVIFLTSAYSLCYMHIPDDPLLRPEHRSDIKTH